MSEWGLRLRRAQSGWEVVLDGLGIERLGRFGRFGKSDGECSISIYELPGCINMPTWLFMCRILPLSFKM